MKNPKVVGRPLSAPAPPNSLFTHDSGATSSHSTPRFALVPGYGERNTALRFGYGNHKHEHDNNVLADANWLVAARERDYKFFQDRFGHVREHLKQEERGIEDLNPGGNLGAIGWYQEVASFLAVKDPEFYEVVRGLRTPDDYSGDAPTYGRGEI